MNTIKKFIKIIQEDIIGPGNQLMAVVWLGCLGGVIGLVFYTTSESKSFLGVAESRDQQISFEYAVEIKQMHIIPGQSIRKGDLLMELDQSELNSRIRGVRAQLAKLESEKLVRQHLNGLINNSSESSLSDSLVSDPLIVEIKDLKLQLGDLEEQRKNLYIFASRDGIISGIHFRKGEKVSAFTNIINISSEHPTYVEGFIHETLNTKLEIGKLVEVTALSSGHQTYGKVIGIGSKIVLMPTRLMAHSAMQVYGREVVVEIPVENGFLLGEKVQITPKMSFTFLPQAKATMDKKIPDLKITKQQPQEFIVPSELAQRFRFEPSGAIYLEDLKKYLVISDDTDTLDSATLFLVSHEGQVDRQNITLLEVPKISDMESISQAGDYIYIMSSLSLSGKGKEKEERNQFLRTKRNGIKFSETTSVSFKKLLTEALNSSKDKSLLALFKDKKKLNNLEIESHFIVGKDLYIGLKKPLTHDGQSIIVKINAFDSIFSKQILAGNQLTLWRTISFKQKASETEAQHDDHQLSDIVNIDGNLYVTTVCNNEGSGALWKLEDQSNNLSPLLIKFYDNLRPEGLAYNSKEQTLMVTFDQKQKSAKFSFVDLKTDGVAGEMRSQAQTKISFEK